MRDQALLDKIDLHLIRVLHTVLTERSVSRAAIRLGMYQPAVSAALKRPARAVGRPAAGALGLGHGAHRRRAAHDRARGQHPARGRDAVQRRARLRSADRRHHLPHRGQRLPGPAVPAAAGGAGQERRRRCATSRSIRCRPTPTTTRTWRSGQVDLVIGNWLKPPDDLHMARLFGDEMVSLVNKDHPAVRRGWDLESWLAAEHIAPTPLHPGARGHHRPDARRDGPAAQHHGALRALRPDPDMVASSLLVLTTGRQYCERFVDAAAGRRSSIAPSRCRASCTTSCGTSAPIRRARRAGCASASRRWRRRCGLAVPARGRPRLDRIPEKTSFAPASRCGRERHERHKNETETSAMNRNREQAPSPASGHVESARPRPCARSGWACERLFKLSEHNTTVRTELVAGLTTFLTMAYIIFVEPVDPRRRGHAEGRGVRRHLPDRRAGHRASWRLYANYPIALAPGMGLNAYFAYVVVLADGLHLAGGAGRGVHLGLPVPARHGVQAARADHPRHPAVRCGSRSRSASGCSWRSSR